MLVFCSCKFSFIFYRLIYLERRTSLTCVGSLMRFRFFFSMVLSWMPSMFDFLLLAAPLALGFVFFFFFFLHDSGFGCFFFFFFNFASVFSGTGKPSLFFIETGLKEIKRYGQWQDLFKRLLDLRQTEIRTQFFHIRIAKCKRCIQLEFYCFSA